jgi:hypothetical protein
MWPDGQQHDFDGRTFARQQFISQQVFLADELEFLDEHARQVAFLFLSDLRVFKNCLYGGVQHFFIACQ